MCRIVWILWDLWSWHPPVGVWIGILGLLGVLVPFFRDLARIGRHERALWTVVMFALLLLEIKSVYQDRNEHDLQQAEARERETKNFERIAKGITEAIDVSDKNFAETMNRSNLILAGVRDTIKTQTGGDSFAFVTFTPEPNQQFLIAITSHGKYPLRDIHVTMMDEERRLQAMQEFNKHPEGDWIKAIQGGDTYFQIPYLRPQGPEAPSGDVEILGGYPFGSKDTNDLTIAFSSLNGHWNERLHLRRIGGKWVQALSVIGPTAKSVQHPFEYFDPGYPDGEGIAKRDWPLGKAATTKGKAKP